MPVRTPRHAASQRRFSALARGSLLAGLTLVLFGTSTFAIAYNDIQGNIDTHDIDDYLGDRPTADGAPAPIDPAAGEDINVLLLGSDLRVGDVNDEYGTTPEGGQRSDTAMLAHISADRERVEVVSIPRDTLVTIPSCRLADGTWTAPQHDTIFNRAFSTGAAGGDLGTAAACTMRTVEELTGVYVDDFVVVDFAGFINVVDALGGVPMCLEEPIQDRRAHADLPAGPQVLDGRDALAFARTRYSVGDGSDISRIGRQQELVGAIASEALSKNLLTDLPALYRFLDAATATLTTGNQLGSVSTLAGLAYSLRTIALEDITFTTMPFDWAGDRVRPSPEAETLWAALRADEPIEAAMDTTGETPSAGPTDGTDDGATDGPVDGGTEAATEESPTQAPPATAEPTPTPTGICP